MTQDRLKRGLRATFLGMGINAALAAVKFVAGVLGNSQALIADAVESLADVISSVVVWRALVVAAAPADEEHPYGHGKAEPIAAAIVASMLLAAAVGIGWHSLNQIFVPHPGPKPFTLVILLAVLAIKEGLFRFALRESAAMDSTVVRADAWHHRSDAITSLAAGVGITVSLVGGPRWVAADSIAAVVAAVIIAWNGWTLLGNAVSELMDTSPQQAMVGEIRRIAMEVPGVHAVEKCLVRKMGYHYFVDMHLEVDPQMTVLNAHAIAHAVKDRIRQQLPSVSDVLVHVEPAGEGGER